LLLADREKNPEGFSNNRRLARFDDVWYLQFNFHDSPLQSLKTIGVATDPTTQSVAKQGFSARLITA